LLFAGCGHESGGQHVEMDLRPGGHVRGRGAKHSARHLDGGRTRHRYRPEKSVRGKNSQYSCSLNHAHLMSNSLRPATPGKCEGVNGELSNRLVGARVWFVIKDVHGAIPDLQEVDVSGDSSFRIPVARCKLDAMFPF